MQGNLTANDVFEMLEGMGEPVTKKDLESIGIRYDFGKKTFYIYLYYAKTSKSKNNALNVEKTHHVRKTEERKIKTLTGEKVLKFSLWHCQDHDSSTIKPLSIINGICPPDRTFNSKVMIAVGLLRWFLNLQREEIQLLFYARGTNISTGEISYLSEEFLLRYYIFHKKHTGQLKSLFDKNGGMILHLDGTGEAEDDKSNQRKRIKLMLKTGLIGLNGPTLY